MSQHNLLSKKAIEDNVKSEKIFTLNNEADYNQSNNNWKQVLNTLRESEIKQIEQIEQIKSNVEENHYPKTRVSIFHNIFKLFGHRIGGKSKNKNKKRYSTRRKSRKRM
jgi:hypothetical protein